MRRMPRMVALVAGVLVSAAVAAPVRAQEPAPFPDLVSDQASGPILSVHVFDGAPRERLLLRFHSYVHNAGPGVLHMRGEGAADGQMTDVFQLVGANRIASPAEMVYEDRLETNADGHDHWHLQSAARYSLWDDVGEVAAAQKVGFCLLDSERVTTGGARVDIEPPACGSESSSAVEMGVSAGWRDLYSRNLAFQWVDVSDTQPGDYRLRSEVDPDDVVREVAGEEDNGFADLAVRIPGHKAVDRTVAPGPVTIALDTQRIEPASGTLAGPQFRIDEPPQHGTLSVATNVWTTNRFVRYTPDDPSHPQPDAFRYSARAADSSFPRSPTRAVVTIGDGNPVAISGAPGAMVGGTSVQLQSEPGVEWSASAGTITSGGVFTAPLRNGPVEVRAEDAGGTADTVTIDVSVPPPPDPAPLPAGAPGGDSASVPGPRLAPAPPARLPRKSIESATAQRIGRFVAVTTVPGRSGTLRVILKRGKKVLARCRTRAAAGRPYTCRLRRPRGSVRNLRVVLELKRLDGTRVRQGVRISTAHVH